jgi:hypothetical protein
LTSTDIILLDVRSMVPIEQTPLQTRLLTSLDLYAHLKGPHVPAIGASVSTYRGKLFLLVSQPSFPGLRQTKSNLQVGTLQHWNDRILSWVHRGDFLAAIRLALQYYEGSAPGNLVDLPEDLVARHSVLSARIRELIHASLDWAFSEDRMHDDTHYSADGRGVDLTTLFEGLATCCIEASLAMDDLDFLFDQAYEDYAAVGIQGIFLATLEPYILDGRIREIPPGIIQALIGMHDDRKEYDLAEAIIWHVDPMSLDINQAVRLCEAHGLWDALVHVYTRTMRDYVAPIVKLLQLVRDAQDRPESGIDAYKLYAYIENVLCGLSYPSGEHLPEAEASYARPEVYAFIFSSHSVRWPTGPDGLVVSAPDRPYPYLDLLLRFDSEAFLHAMDGAMEDPYLDDARGVVNRQSIVNLLLDVMDPETFHSGDITFLHIFVARNLPKYPQFLFIPPSTLHRILISLASDPDQSTREDRQLAAEYLLSAYTPHDMDAMLERFETAGFYRILRTWYRRERKWASLINTILRDPDADEETFASLDEIIRSTPKQTEISRAIISMLPQLLDLSVRQTALLLDRDLPSCHAKAIESLSHSEHKQMAYLRCLLDPADEEEKGPLPPRRDASPHVEIPYRHRYVLLLCRYDPTAVISFLDTRGPEFFDLPQLASELQHDGSVEGQLWALDRQHRTNEALETVGRELRSRGVDLGEALVSHDLGAMHLIVQGVGSVTRMAVRLCREHSSEGAKAEDMWFGVLHEVIELVYAAASLPSDASDPATAQLRSLVQETLGSLLSTSSPSISFPRLFKRLVEASGSTKSKGGRAYSEFRTILSGMLESYRAEGDMLTMTTRLVEADLFVLVEQVTAKRQTGWRPAALACSECGHGVLSNSGGALVVMASGLSRHKSC